MTAGVRRYGGARVVGAGRVKTLFIEPDSPWENGNNESFNGKPRDGLLAREADRAYVLTLGAVAMEGRAGDLLADPSMRELYLGGGVAG